MKVKVNKFSLVILVFIYVSSIIFFGCSGVRKAAGSGSRNTASAPTSFKEVSIPKGFLWKNDQLINLQVQLNGVSSRQLVLVDYINSEGDRINTFKGVTSSTGTLSYHASMPAYVEELIFKIGSNSKTVAISGGKAVY
jgi:hypothetical protein